MLTGKLWVGILSEIDDKSTKSNGYLCLCGPGKIGDGFKTDIGGDGCSDSCDLFSVDCGNEGGSRFLTLGF